MDAQQKAKAVVEVIVAMLDTIKDAGPQGIPSGHLYAACMGTMSLAQYQRIIDIFKSTGKVVESGHVLRVVR